MAASAPRPCWPCRLTSAKSAWSRPTAMPEWDFSPACALACDLAHDPVGCGPRSDPATPPCQPIRGNACMTPPQSATARVNPSAADPTVSKIERPTPAGANAPGFGSDVIADALRSLDVPYIALTPGASYRGLHDSIVNYLG